MTPTGEHPYAPLPVSERLEAVLALRAEPEGVEVIVDGDPEVSDEEQGK